MQVCKKSLKLAIQEAEKQNIGSASFFKTGPGEYAEGEVFIGITVPTLRKIAKVYKCSSLLEIEELLYSYANEERLLALLILVKQYEKGDSQKKEEIFNFYCTHIRQVNNWNLVDSSAYHIVGAYLFEKERSLLYTLVKSENMWERRIAIIATLFFIRKHDLACTFEIASLLLQDKHDLIHKAVGWMLREAGKKDETALMSFLDQYVQDMPRVMLRYAIEKFSSSEKKRYLKK